MEFEDMKKIWNEQNQAYLYAIDEQKLKSTVLNKKESTSRSANKLEWITIGANIFGGTVLIGDQFWDSYHMLGVVLGTYMLIAAGYIYYRRTKRLKGEDNFERTMIGDLKHALANAIYMVRLSLIMLIYFIPVSLLTTIAWTNRGKPGWTLLAVCGFFLIVFVASILEHQKIHVARKKRIEGMIRKMEE